MNHITYQNQNKYLIYIVAFYITIKLIAFIMTHKIIQFHNISICFCALIIPIWFLTGDIIAEVYNYKIAKNLLLLAVICQTIMALICYIGSKTISPNNFLPQSLAYKEIFEILPFSTIINSLAIFIGGLVNAYVIVLFKNILNGKYFIIRCFIANSIGELVFTIISYSSGLFEGLNIFIVVKLITSSYIVKLIISPLLLIPTSIISNKLKNLEFSNNKNNILDEVTLKKSINSKNNFILHLKENSKGESYFTTHSIKMPIEHELGKLSENYKNISLRFGEFKSGISIELHNSLNSKILICLSGEIEITTNNRIIKYLKNGNVLFLNDIKGIGHKIKTISDSTLIIINLSSNELNQI